MTLCDRLLDWLMKGEVWGVALAVLYTAFLSALAGWVGAFGAALTIAGIGWNQWSIARAEATRSRQQLFLYQQLYHSAMAVAQESSDPATQNAAKQLALDVGLMRVDGRLDY